MNEHYDQNEVNIRDLEEFVQSKEKRKIDLSIAFLIVLIGVFGFYFALPVDKDEEAAAPKDFIYDDDFSSKETVKELRDLKEASPQPVPVITQSTKEKDTRRKALENQLQIAGNMEAMEDIRFAIDSYNQKAEYIMTMGDGTIKKVNTPYVRHRYEYPGEYKVKLEVAYQGERAVIAERNLQIMEAIAVANDAPYVDF